MRFKTKLFALLIGGLVLGRNGWAESHDHHSDEVKLTADAIQRYEIKVAAVSRQQLSPTLTVPARVSFNTEAMAHVGALVKGRAIEIKARVGDAVKKGDELLVVESSELGEAQSDFLQKQTAASVAESAIEPANNAAERARKLFDQNQGIALAEVQKRQAELKAAEGALQSAQAAQTAAENKLHLMGMSQDAVKALAKSTEIDPHYVVRAPIAGQVVQREVTLGELVAPEKEALLVLANMGTLWVLANVPETRLRDVARGAKARVTIAAISDEAFEGKVSFISPTLDQDTQTALVRIDVANGGDLKPGMFATAEIVADRSPASAPTTLAVPEDSVQTVEGAPAVFVPVEGEANTFAKRAITVGKSVGGMVPILSGLKEGEQIVVHGSFILKAELGKSEAAHEH
jgi:cobalt-zinc-cadmium efflux system membrane fusion protein